MPSPASGRNRAAGGVSTVENCLARSDDIPFPVTTDFAVLFLTNFSTLSQRRKASLSALSLTLMRFRISSIRRIPTPNCGDGLSGLRDRLILRFFLFSFWPLVATPSNTQTACETTRLGCASYESTMMDDEEMLEMQLQVNATALVQIVKM